MTSVFPKSVFPKYTFARLRSWFCYFIRFVGGEGGEEGGGGGEGWGADHLFGRTNIFFFSKINGKGHNFSGQNFTKFNGSLLH